MHFFLIHSDGAPSQFKNNNNILNLALHHQDFAFEAGWTFSSAGHGKSECDGLGAAVKSAARKYLLQQGPEVAFSDAKDFYRFARDKINRTIPSKRSVRPQEIVINGAGINSSSDEETGETVSQSARSIEIRWLAEKDIEHVFQTVLKTRWNKLSTKSNLIIFPKPFYIYYLM
jgi:hypothetical protein